MPVTKQIHLTDYNFSDKMKKLIYGYMRRNELRQKDFAKLMGMKEGDFSDLINGKQRWTVRSLLKVKGLLDVIIYI